jgi:hypothetical protein
MPRLHELLILQHNSSALQRSLMLQWANENSSTIFMGVHAENRLYVEKMHLRTIIWTQFLEDRENWKEKYTIINYLFSRNLLAVCIFNRSTWLNICKAKGELCISDIENQGGSIFICGGHIPACSIGLLINPFTIKSVAVHKSPTDVKLMFISVFWVPYAPVTKMHLQWLTNGSFRNCNKS